MFVAKDQEYTDIHTGITIAFGEHAGADPNAASPATRSGWLRVSVPGQKGEPPRISTIQFRAGNIVGSDKNLTATEKPAEEEHRATEAKPEVHAESKREPYKSFAPPKGTK